MRTVTIVAGAMLGLCLAHPAEAAWSNHDGPYYITPSAGSFYVDCRKPSFRSVILAPSDDVTAGPIPNSTSLGALGYSCVRGTYAYDPFYPPRCRVNFIRTPHGWQRERVCF